MKEGNDRLYNANKTDIDQMHTRLKSAQDELYKNKHALAITKQEIRNHQLRNMVLEENIDEQIDQ